MKIYYITTALTIFLLLLGCGKPQPSEVQKARLDAERMVQCLISVNHNPNDEDKGLFSELLFAEAVGKLSDITDKDWELLNADSEIVLVGFFLDSTKYECKFSLFNKIELLKVARNGEVVFDKVINDKLVEEGKRIKAEKEAVELKIKKEVAELPQPSEVQKARLDAERMVQCLISVNYNLNDEDKSLLSGLSLYAEVVGKLSDITDKNWELLDTNSEIILVSFSLDSTKYECEFSLFNKIELLKVARNGEVVFDKVINDKLVEEGKRIKAEKEAAELKIKKEKEAAELKIKKEKEAAELKIKKEKEAAELKIKLQTWAERSYLSVSYKYYEKFYRDSEAKYNDETLVIVCAPDFARVNFYKGTFLRFKGQKDVEFKFYLKNGEKVVYKFDLTSNGNIGRAYSSKVYIDEGQNDFFIKKLIESNSIEVGGFVFDMDDISQVPCI